MITRSQILRNIAETFPCFRRGAIAHCFSEGEFKPALLEATLQHLSKGEQHVCRLLLTLWCLPAAPAQRNWQFSPFQAIAIWNAPHRAAYAAWCRNPIYP